MLAETPSTSAQPQTWAAIATAIAGALAAVVKKRLSRPRRSDTPTPRLPDPHVVTQSQLQSGLDTMRDRVTAGYMAMAEKFDANQKEILSAIGTQGSAIEKRLDALESAVARLDERTKNS